MKKNLIYEKQNNFNNELLKYYNGNFYVSERIINNLQTECNEIEKQYNKQKYFFISIMKWKIKSKIKETNKQIYKLKECKELYNKNYLEKTKENTPIELRHVNGNTLDDNQLNSILIDEPNTLVIAGAGTGKTTTITAKTKYLLLKEKINPEEILLLTYTKAAAEEMKERIFKETNQKLDIFTFHKLGKNIITKVEGKVPVLTTIELKKFIRNSIKDFMTNDNDYKERINNYLLYNQYLGVTKFDFLDGESYLEYLKSNPLITLKNENVKSFEEVMIANFLVANQIKYEYEKKYIIDTTDLDYGQYRPDFYLPEYDIWIEHFGIDRNGNVPSFFSGENPKKVYNDSIKWKRKIHKENNTKLIETYSYENKEGILLENLENKLIEYNIIIKPLDNNILLNKFIEDNKSLMNGFIELFTTIINLLKINKISVNDFKEIEMTIKEDELRQLVLPVYEIYLKTLIDLNEIDFIDMLNKATDYIVNNKYKNPYKYVIVDEFQDMSKITYNLLIALRKSNNYNLYAVGDDWQSIFRFAGSDVSYITHFTDYFGLAEVFKLPNTYRYSQSIANIAGKFIMKNPNQITKDIISLNGRKTDDVGKIEGYTENRSVNFLEDKLLSLPQNSEVLFLSRYTYDYKILNDLFIMKKDYTKKTINIQFVKRKDLKITYRTIHSSKGLEADYVFVLNNKIGNYGFPSTIQDNTILNYFLSNKDNYKFSEERRLMYVALTRARKNVRLLTNKQNQSIFVKEITNDFSKELKREIYVCPKCGGRLIVKCGPYSKFMGCSNYPVCKYTKKLKS